MSRSFKSLLRVVIAALGLVAGVADALAVKRVALVIGILGSVS